LDVGKSASGAATKPQVTPEEALIDEYCELAEKMAAWQPALNPHAARFAEVSSLILGRYAQAPADRSILAPGARYLLPISAGRMKRSVVNLEKFFKAVGRQAYLEMCRPTLGNVEKAIPKEKQSLYIAESQTGNRTIGRPVRREAVETRLAA
jgi:hypothetical protein